MDNHSTIDIYNQSYRIATSLIAERVRLAEEQIFPRLEATVIESLRFAPSTESRN